MIDVYLVFSDTLLISISFNLCRRIRLESKLLTHFLIFSVQLTRRTAARSDWSFARFCRTSTYPVESFIMQLSPNYNWKIIIWAVRPSTKIFNLDQNSSDFAPNLRSEFIFHEGRNRINQTLPTAPFYALFLFARRGRIENFSSNVATPTPSPLFILFIHFLDPLFIYILYFH